MRIIRAIVGALFIGLIYTSVTMGFSATTVALFAFLSLIFISIIDPSKYPLKSSSKLTKNDLDLIANDAFESDPEFRNKCQNIESELRAEVDTIIQGQLTDSSPNPAFKRDSPRSGRAP